MNYRNKSRPASRKAEEPAADGTTGADAFSQDKQFRGAPEVVEAQRAVRDWCMDNPDGVVMARGDSERERDQPWRSPQDVDRGDPDYRGRAAESSRTAKRAQDDQLRAQWHEIAQIEWPELFDKRTEVYQTSSNS